MCKSRLLVETSAANADVDAGADADAFVVLVVHAVAGRHGCLVAIYVPS